MDVDVVLQLFSATIGTILGVIGIVAETKTSDGKLTRWARWALAGVVLSGLISLVADTKAAKDEEEARTEQLAGIQRTINEVGRTLTRIPERLNAEITITVAASELGKSKDELVKRALGTSPFRDDPNRYTAPDDSEDLRSFFAPLTDDIRIELARSPDGADLALIGRFTPEGVTYDSSTDRFEFWGRPFEVRFLKNSQRIASFVDLPNAGVKLTVFSIICAGTPPCGIREFALSTLDGRRVAVKNFTRNTQSGLVVYSGTVSAP